MREPQDFVELPTRQGYDRWASVYDDDNNPLIVLEHRQIDGLMGDLRGLHVLDAGCGTGRHALPIARSGAHVTAVDFSDEMLAKARAKPGAESVNFIRHDIQTSLPFRDGSFHRVISGLVVDHIAELTSFFTELNRVCRSDGTIVITVMHPALTLRGVQARFTDPKNGLLTLPASHQHQVSDYVMAALKSGSSIKQMREYLVDEPLAAKSERARRYLGWPMLLVLELTP